MNITAVIPLPIFNEIEARAKRQHIGKAAIIRQIVCDWYDDVIANSGSSGGEVV